MRFLYQRDFVWKLVFTNIETNKKKRYKVNARSAFMALNAVMEQDGKELADNYLLTKIKLGNILFGKHIALEQ